MAVTMASERRNAWPVFGLDGIMGDFDIEADRKERSDELGTDRLSWLTTRRWRRFVRGSERVRYEQGIGIPLIRQREAV